MRGFVAIAGLVILSAGSLLGQIAAEAGPAPAPASPVVSPRGAKPTAAATGHSGAPGGLTAQPIGPTGPHDVIVGDLSEVMKFATSGGITAYAVGTTSCNIGSVPLAWIFDTPQHPIIPQNMYRLKAVDGAGRFEQIGMSWCKQGFCALQESLCGPCTPFGIGCQDHLGVGCSDPYSAFLNGEQTNLGPRFQVNASTGAFPFPPATYGTTGGTLITKRLQIPNTDLDPAVNPGAAYFAEGMYIQPEDAADGNGANNASWRRVNVGALTGGGYQLLVTGTTVRQQPAIYGWASLDQSVSIHTVDVPSDGRFILAYKVTDLGGGQWHYEYALHNLNSHRSGRSFSIPIPAGVAVTNIGFHDINYHSQTITGMPASAVVDNVDWTATVSGGAITWSTTPHSPAVDGTANALRWATMYNFRFDANRPPVRDAATLGLFRPGTPSSVMVTALVPLAPPCPADFDASGGVGGVDLGSMLGVWTGAASYAPCPPHRPQDLNADCKVNGLDLGLLLGAWGVCP